MSRPVQKMYKNGGNVALFVDLIDCRISNLQKLGCPGYYEEWKDNQEG